MCCCYCFMYDVWAFMANIANNFALSLVLECTNMIHTKSRLIFSNRDLSPAKSRWSLFFNYKPWEFCESCQLFSILRCFFFLWYALNYILPLPYMIYLLLIGSFMIIPFVGNWIVIVHEELSQSLSIPRYLIPTLSRPMILGKPRIGPFLPNDSGT